MADSPTVQRSFRLARDTATHLDEAAMISGESRNALVDRLLREALRIEQHPLIRFRTGAAGRREPLLVGTRLKVRQIIATLRHSDNDVAAAADYLSVPRALVDAAIAYYADYRAEVDADATGAQQIEDAELARWERQQAVGR